MGTSGPFRQVAPDQLQVREGGGCLCLFGLPFLAAGILVTLIGVGIVPVQNAAQVPAWAWPLILLMGLIFVAVGGDLVLGRRWTTLDTGRGIIRKQWGLLVPLRGEEYPAHDYEAVLLSFETGDSDTADRYPVLLRAGTGRADLALSSTSQYGESRDQAAAVARFLGFPLVDTSTDHESVTRADRVDAPFQERLRTGEDRREEAVQLVIFGCAVLLFVVVPLLGVVNSVVLANRGCTLVTASPTRKSAISTPSWCAPSAVRTGDAGSP
jgi:hypothetical protein